MIDHKFDDILKQKLNDMIDPSKSDWSVFRQKLENAQTTQSRVESDFDSEVKQKLAGIKLSGIASDWSTFEQILDEDQVNDDMLDEKVSSEMNNLRATYRQDHWEILQNALEYQKQRNNSIIGYKIIELSLLLILFLSASNIYKYLPSTFEVEKPVIIASQSEQISNEISQSLNNKITEEKYNAQVESSANTFVQNELVRNAFSNRATNNVPTLTLENQQGKINTETLILDDSALPLIHSISPSENPYQAIDKRISSNLALNKIESIAFNTITSYDNDSRSSVLMANHVSPQIVQPISNSETKKSILIYAGLDNNLVNSPFDDVYDIEGFRTYGIGYSAGLEYAITRGKKEFSFGLGYSNRAYEPRIIEELTGNPALTLYETSLDHIEFNIMSLSASLKHIFWETDNWNLDFGVGLSANVVVSSNYSIETRISRDGQFVSSRGGRLSSSDLDDKPLHDGIFENGSLQENIYLTTDLSFGLTRQLSTNTSFILRPEYSLHSFSNGIGPNNDLINNLSINLGIKYLL